MASRTAKLAFGGAVAAAAATAVRRRSDLPDPRSLAQWVVFHGSARALFGPAARAGDPLARLVCDEKLRSDPHPFYDELRAAPVVGGRIAAVTARHDLCSMYLRDSTTLSGVATETMPAPARAVLRWAEDPTLGNPLDRPSMVLTNGPEHEVYRRLAMKAFTARAVGGLRPHIENLATELLDAMTVKARTGDPVDIVTDLADILPVLVIAEILGVPTSMQPTFRAWATTIAAAADIGISYRQARAAEAAIREMSDWLVAHMRRLRADPGENLLSRMVTAADDEARHGVRVDERGLVANAGLLLFAGFETTVNLIGNGADLLLRHPDQLQTLRADPSLWPNAIEEMLRYASPAQNAFRYRDADTELHGVPLRRGQFLVLLLGGANRDPAVFADPHRFDVTRANAREHLAFGVGAHFCVGAALARMEGEITLRRLFERFPDLAVAGSPVRRPTRILHGLASLPVRLGSTEQQAPAAAVDSRHGC